MKEGKQMPLTPKQLRLALMIGLGLFLIILMILSILPSKATEPRDHWSAEESSLIADASNKPQEDRLQDRSMEFLSVLAVDVDQGKQQIGDLKASIESLEKVVASLANASQSHLPSKDLVINNVADKLATNRVPEQADKNGFLNRTNDYPRQGTTTNFGFNSEDDPWQQTSRRAGNGASIGSGVLDPADIASIQHSLDSNNPLNTAKYQAAIVSFSRTSAINLPVKHLPSHYQLIPKGSLVLKSRLLTALIGNIPKDLNPAGVSGDIPFSAVIQGPIHHGARMLSAPISGAIITGRTQGNFLLRCAYAQVHDIIWFYQGKYFTQASLPEQGSLGYLTSQQGNPCIPGTLFSSLPAAIGNEVLLSGASGIAKGAIEYQQSLAPEQVMPYDLGLGTNYVFSEALDSTREVLIQKFLQNQDTVIVPTGTQTVIHFTQSIQLIPLVLP